MVTTVCLCEDRLCLCLREELLPVCEERLRAWVVRSHAFFVCMKCIVCVNSVCMSDLQVVTTVT